MRNDYSRLVIDELEGLYQVSAIAEEWDELIDRSSSATPWVTPAAVLPWFGLSSELTVPRVMTVRSHGRLVGLMPFSLVEYGPFSLYVTAGAGYGFDGEPAIDDGEDGVAAAIAEWIESKCNERLTSFYLRRLDTDGHLMSTLSNRQVAVKKMIENEPISVVDFDSMADVESYFAVASKKHEVPRLYRRIGEQFSRVEYLSEDPAPAEALDVLRDMMLRRFGQDLRIFKNAQNRELTRCLVERMIESGRGRMSSLFLDDERVAIAFSPRTAKRHVWYSVAYEPDLRNLGLGHVEPYEMLRSAYAMGAHQVDLGDARFDYKQTWANAEAMRSTVSVGAMGRRGAMADNLRRLALRLHRRAAAEKTLAAI